MRRRTRLALILTVTVRSAASGRDPVTKWRASFEYGTDASRRERLDKHWAAPSER